MIKHALKACAKGLIPRRFHPFLRSGGNLRPRWEQVKGLLQGRNVSFLRHDAQYRVLTLARAIDDTGVRVADDTANSRELDLDLLIKANPELTIAVDIGSGIGWLSGWLATRFEKVISIEPSRSAVELARDIQKAHKDRIIWRIGLAEAELGKLALTAPTLFVTGRVLTHLADRDVKKILRAIDSIAPKGSLMALAELWGEPHHHLMWHVRTDEWWKAAIGPRWQVEFLAQPIEAPGRYVGVRALCVHER